jgi:hypothetical protein
LHHAGCAPVSRPLPLRPSDLQGLGRLGIDAVLQVTDLVEAVHGGIQRLATLRAPGEPQRLGGIAGLAYGGVRGVTGLVGRALEAVTARVGWPADDTAGSGPREALLAALNGVVGDHLEASGNPLAIPLRLLHEGQALPLHDRDALRAALPQAGSRVLVLLHGLCMSPWQWRAPAPAEDADVQALAERLGYRVLHLHYNSGRQIGHNGADFADALHALFAGWPQPIDELVLLGHSMGGLVARSACHAGIERGHAWAARPLRLICLGTPHHGAPLERAGNGVDRLLAALPLVSPFARLGHLRSAGITDLRHGAVLPVTTQGKQRFTARGLPAPAPPLPESVELHVIAGTRSPVLRGATTRLRSDGLVPVASALGQHPKAERDLRVPAVRQATVAGVGHIALLHDARVLGIVRGWLGGAAAPAGGGGATRLP